MTQSRSTRLLDLLVMAAVLVVAALSATPGVASSAPEPPPVFFRDVLYGQPFHREVSWLADQKITTGYADGTFRPAAPVSREAMAAFLYRYAGSPAYVAPSVSAFVDVPRTHQFFREISWLAGRRITTGYPDGTFRPAAPVSREAMAAFLYRYAGSPAYVAPSVSAFVDVPRTHQFYREISWLAGRRITTGYPDRTFRPAAPVSREAMAAFLYRYAGSPAYQAPQDNRPPVVTAVPAWQWSQILATGTWRPGCPGGWAAFVRVEVPFLGFDGRYHRGAVVVNRDIAGDARDVFAHLAAERFPLNTVIPVEHFGGWDRVSEAANNTSAFNCRKPAEAISDLTWSPHANGRAFDLNPVQNPWIRPGTTVWEPAAGTLWATRRDLTWQSFGVVAVGGIPLTWFTNRGGWRWQGGPVDYMHFDTGYPSVPMSGHGLGQGWAR